MPEIVRSIEEIMFDYIDSQKQPSGSELLMLCELAGQTEMFASQVEEIMLTLARHGWTLADMTTDDSEGVEVELLPPQKDDDA